jgi:hypothetical protein
LAYAKGGTANEHSRATIHNPRMAFPHLNPSSAD